MAWIAAEASESAGSLKVSFGSRETTKHCQLRCVLKKYLGYKVPLAPVMDALRNCPPNKALARILSEDAERM